VRGVRAGDDEGASVSDNLIGSKLPKSVTVEQYAAVYAVAEMQAARVAELLAERSELHAEIRFLGGNPTALRAPMDSRA